MSARSREHFGEFYRHTSESIYAFCRALNFKPSWQQQELLNAVQRAADGTGSNWLACRSGQGPGKTKTSTIAGLWWAWRWIDGMTVVTAPTMRQCRDVWLVEARKTVEAADPAIQRCIDVTKSKVTMFGRDDWGAKLVTATKETNFQGYHNPHMAIIAEEASGIPREIIETCKGTLSNNDALFLQIGNPNTRDCAFFDCFNSQRHRWFCLRWNAEESPTWIVNPQRNKDLEDEFGRDSDVYRVRVLGEFPIADPNCVLSSELVEVIMDPDLMLKAVAMQRDHGGHAKQFGMDFARFGGDENTIFRRSGNAIVEWARYPRTDPSEVVDKAFLMQKEAGWRDQDCIYVADAGGMGQGVMHRFYDAGKEVVEFHNGGCAIDVDYDNRITEAWFRFAKKVKERRCYVPRDNILLQQLCGRQYYMTRKGKIVLETKDEYMKRGYESPDRADGTVLAFDDEILAVGNVTSRDNNPAARLLGVRTRR